MKKTSSFLAPFLFLALILSPALLFSGSSGGSPSASSLTGQVPLANGGTGANLTDPNADRIGFWDDSAGAFTWLTAGSGLTLTDTTLTASGGIGGSTGATDNAALRADEVGGSTSQGSGLIIGDVSGSSLPLSTQAGNAIAITATAPTAANGASQAGKAASLTASPAVASLDTAGAAAGGAVTITSGAAARLTSGNAAGGDINLMPGAGVGTGAPGAVAIPSTRSIRFTDTPGATSHASFKSATVGYLNAYDNGGAAGSFSAANFVAGGDDTPANSTIWIGAGSVRVGSGGIYGFSSAATTPPGSTTSDTRISRAAAGVLRVGAGSGAIGALQSALLVEANTAGSGAPNVLTAVESGTVLTNEGTTAKNYHTLPTAASGYVFEFIVQDADGIRIVANTDDTIRVIDKVTAAAGYIESTTIGSTVRLVSANAVEWYAMSIHGVWTDGTFTYDDTSLTTP